MQKPLSRPPLPFVGNKKNFLRLVREVLDEARDDWSGWTFVDLF